MKKYTNREFYKICPSVDPFSFSELGLEYQSAAGSRSLEQIEDFFEVVEAIPEMHIVSRMSNGDLYNYFRKDARNFQLCTGTKDPEIMICAKYSRENITDEELFEMNQIMSQVHQEYNNEERQKILNWVHSKNNN